MYLLTRFSSQLKGESGASIINALTPSTPYAIARPLAHKMLLGLRIRSGLADRPSDGDGRDKACQGGGGKEGRRLGAVESSARAIYDAIRV